MGGHLLSRGIRVQQYQIHKSICRIDPEGTLARRLNVVHCQCYRGGRNCWCGKIYA